MGEFNRISRACQVAQEEVDLRSNQRRQAIPQLSDTTPQFILSTSDKTVSLRAALEWRLRST